VSSEINQRPAHRIVCHLDEALRDRGMTLTELSQHTGITMANLSILKTNKARAIRFTTLTMICDVLNTTPSELFTITGIGNARR
jgi:putative transcriptional regulator